MKTCIVCEEIKPDQLFPEGDSGICTLCSSLGWRPSESSDDDKLLHRREICLQAAATAVSGIDKFPTAGDIVYLAQGLEFYLKTGNVE